MSRDQLARARELIQKRRYDEARRILEDIDHPTAQKWLDKLDDIAPAKRSVSRSKQSAKPVQRSQSGSGSRTVIAALLSLLIGIAIGVGIGYVAFSEPVDEGPSELDMTRQAIIDANNTTEAERNQPTPTEDPFELTSQAIINENATTSALLTQTAEATAAVTEDTDENLPPFAIPESTEDSSSGGPGGLPFDPNEGGSPPGGPPGSDNGGLPFGNSTPSDDDNRGGGPPFASTPEAPASTEES